MVEEIYVNPIIKVFPTFAEAKDFFDKEGGVIFFEGDQEKLSIAAISQGTRNLIVGEPGVGKSELLKKIGDYLSTQGDEVTLISLRRGDALKQIDEFLKKETTVNKVLILDALDEVQGNRFPEVIEKIIQVSGNHPEVSIFLSSRILFIEKYASSFPDFRFLVVPPFTERQVVEYLRNCGRTEDDIEVLLNRVTSFNHRLKVIQIPRYLSFLNEFLEKKGSAAASQISRNELFDFFIYRKLEVEEKIKPEQQAILKRVLEKLALVMEIYQTNVISHDELMTFFDELKSDLKNVALSQINLQFFFDNFLLKPSQDSKGNDGIEFENTEFQEYLAAKEISRFSDPSRTAFSFAVDEKTGETFPSWFNSLSFLVDMRPELLPQLTDYSGMRSEDAFRAMDDTFITFLGRIDPRAIVPASRKDFFLIILRYYERTQQWLAGELIGLLATIYEPSLEDELKRIAQDAETQSGVKHFVTLGNIAYVIMALLERGVAIDRPFWKEKLIQYTQDSNDNGAMQRRVLLALGEFGDVSVLDQIPSLMEGDPLIMRAFLALFRKLAPNGIKTLEYHIEAVKRDDFYGRYGFMELTEPDTITAFLVALNSDEIFLREFIKDTTLFKEEDSDLVKKIDSVFTEEMCLLGREILVKCSDYEVSYSARRSSFVEGFWKLLKRRCPEFLSDIFRMIKEDPNGKTRLYATLDFLVDSVTKEDVPVIVQTMIELGEKDTALSLMFRISNLQTEDSQEIFEEGRKLLPEEYKEWEATRAKIEKEEKQRKKKEDKQWLDEFHSLLEPEPGKYNNGIFRYYLEHKSSLDPLLKDDDKQRLIKLATESILDLVDPSQFPVRITEGNNDSRTYTMSQAVGLFGEALQVLNLLDIDISTYRQKAIDYIPFADDDELQLIFEKFPTIKVEEMSGVIEVYRDRKSDLWRHQFLNFVEVVNKLNIQEAVPILRELVREPLLRFYEREKALVTSDSLSPSADFLREIFEAYKVSTEDNERQLAYTANSLLIARHGDAEAVKWRIGQVVQRVGPFTEQEGVHSVGDFEDEISFGKKFAKPLMELKKPEFISDYLSLLEIGMQIWGQGTEFHAYASYIWEIVYGYFDNLKDEKTYQPLLALEEKTTGWKDVEGASWLLRRNAQLRRSYLGYVGKPQNISEAIKKYNDSKERENKKILSSNDLFYHLQITLEKYLAQWIEGEGAYDLITDLEKIPGKKKEYEKLVQKTLVPLLRYAFQKEGFDADLIREPQLLDDIRVDFWVKYGFIGPIVIEVKLTSNSDMRRKDVSKSISYESMKRYMTGYAATHGIFLVIDNTAAKNLDHIKEVFERISNVSVKTFKCQIIPAKKVSKRISKKAVMKVLRKPKKKSIKKNSKGGV